MRKQNAEKYASKCLPNIKRMLQAYALARPKVRISMRVLKAKNERGNFMYAPKSGAATVMDAALKVIGRECALQCQWFVLESNRGYRIEALLPTNEADQAKIANVGHFLSIDSRPVNTMRGTLKVIVSRFKERLRAGRETISAVKDPFFAMNILCPVGSYDPNVEPAKDDVLFDDSDALLEAVDELLGVVYPVQDHGLEDRKMIPEIEKAEESIIKEPQQLGAQVVEKAMDRAFNPSLEPENVVSTASFDPPPRDLELDFLEHAANRAMVWRSTMYGCDEEDLDIPIDEQTRCSRTRSDESSENMKDLNPWTIAKMNAVIKPRQGPSNTTFPSAKEAFSPSLLMDRENEHFDDENLAPARGAGRNETNMVAHESSAAHIPSASSILPSSAIPASRPEFEHSHIIHNHGLPTPLPSSSPTFGSSQHTLRERITKPKPQRREKAVNKPFVQPMQDRNWFDFGPASAPVRRKLPSDLAPRTDRDIRDIFARTQTRNVASDASLVSQGEVIVDDTNSTEFEKRLQNPVRLDNRVMAPSDKSTGIAFQERVNALTHNQSEWTPINHTPTATVVTPETPISPPIPRRRTTESRRTKSSRLPLERVPENQRMQNLIQEVTISIQTLSTQHNLFRNANFNDVDFNAPITSITYNDFSDATLQSLGLQAIRLLRCKLAVAERDDDEAAALAYVGTLERMGKQ